MISTAQNSRPRQIICLTPVKNESWILPLFLQCASQWADKIIIADQGSTDESREICARFPCVHFIENKDMAYSEAARQRLLIEEARRLYQNAMLVALDADEFLSANFASSGEWEKAKASRPGTVVRFPRIEFYGTSSEYFFDSAQDLRNWFQFGYIDDGAEHQGLQIHSPRVPTPEGASEIFLQEVVVLHYQFIAIRRAASKHRWYQCFERVQYPSKSPQDIEKVYSWRKKGWPRRPSKSEWFQGYRDAGIRIDHVADGDHFWWDWEVLRLFDQYGMRYFAELDIWDVNWEDVRQAGLRLGISGLPTKVIRAPQRGPSLFSRFLWRAKKLMGAR